MGKQRPVLAGLMAVVGIAVLYCAHHRPPTGHGEHPDGDDRIGSPTPLAVLDGGCVANCNTDTGVPDDAPTLR
jgi:hypothetical protein